MTKETHKIFDSFSLSTSKMINEIAVVELVLELLEIDAVSLTSTGEHDPPDCVLEWQNSTVGIEVVALIDSDVRRMNVNVRRGQTDKKTWIGPRSFTPIGPKIVFDQNSVK